MSLRNQVAWNTFIQLAGKFFTIFLGLFILKIITFKLGSEMTGQYLTALTYAQLFTTVGDLGLYAFFVRDYSRNNHSNAFLNQVFTLRILSGFGLFGLASLACLWLPYDISFRLIIILSLASGLLNLYSTTIVGVFQSHLKMSLAVATDSLTRLLTLAGIYFLLLERGPSLASVMVILITASALNLVLNYAFLRKILSISVAFRSFAWKPIMVEIMPIWITAMLTIVYFKIDSVMISLIPLPGGENNFIAAGYYGTAYKLLEVLIAFPGIFLGSVLPLFSTSTNDPDRFRHYLRYAFDFLALTVIPIVFGTYLLAPQLITLISSPEFLPAVPVLRILIFAFICSAFGGVFTYATLSLGKQRRLLKPYIVATIFNVVVNIYAISTFSYIGAAVTTLLTELLIAIAAYRLIKKELSLSLNITVLIKSLGSAAIMAAVLYLIPSESLWILLPTGIVIYGIMILITKAVPESLIPKLLRRTAAS